jgi:hypothetical protein
MRCSGGLRSGLPEFDSREGQEILSTASRPVLRPTHPPLGTGGSFSGGKAAGA